VSRQSDTGHRRARPC